jgi:hypothetical protein
MDTPGNEDLEWMKDAPRLASLPRQVPFAVPPGYFEELAETVMRKTAEHSLPGENQAPFAVPDGYFDQFPTRLQQRLQAPPKRSARVILLRPAFGLAAAAAFLAILLLTQPARDTVPASQEILTAEEIAASGFLDDVDESVVLDALAGEVPSESSVPEIEEYLIENNIDLELLTNEL